MSDDTIFQNCTLIITKKRRKITMAEVQESIINLHNDRLFLRRRKRQRGNFCCIPPIAKLPRIILINILSGLPLQSILACASVCKAWEKLIFNDPEFAKLQFRRSATKEVMIRPEGPGSFSRITYLIALRDLKAFAEFVLPLNEQLTWSGIDMVNSCNGFVCLSKYFDKNPIAICNPMTKEYVNIPRNPVNVRNNPIACGCSLCLEYNLNESDEIAVASGFGYGISSNQYKVVRVIKNRYNSHGFGSLAEVCVLGEGKWRRSIGYAPQIPHNMMFGTYLRGKYYWLCSHENVFEFIVSFDFSTEQFEIVSPHPYFKASKKYPNHMRMQELGGCLTLCDFSSDNHFDIWVMRDLEGKRLWSKGLVVHLRHNRVLDPVKMMSKDEILMVQDSKALVVYNCLTKRIRLHEIRGISQSPFGAVTYVPSFFSLKDIVKGSNKTGVLMVKQMK